MHIEVAAGGEAGVDMEIAIKNFEHLTNGRMINF